MTQTEYDQKKRECWAAFKKHGECEGGSLMADAFFHVFDRAYALGKQEKDAEETVISGWVLVDDTTFKRIVRVHKITQGDYESVWDSGEPEFYLEEEVFPDMTPDSVPVPVEIIIKRKKK